MLSQTTRDAIRCILSRHHALICPQARLALRQNYRLTKFDWLGSTKQFVNCLAEDIWGRNRYCTPKYSHQNTWRCREHPNKTTRANVLTSMQTSRSRTTSLIDSLGRIKRHRQDDVSQLFLDMIVISYLSRDLALVYTYLQQYIPGMSKVMYSQTKMWSCEDGSCGVL